MALVGWITKTGKRTKEQNRVGPIIAELYVKLLKEFGIRRRIPLYLVDEWSWNKGSLKMNSRSVGHYNEGIRVRGGSPHEAVLLRESVLYWENWRTAIPEILRHELVHAKLKGQERGNEHGKPFKSLARKHGVEKVNW